MKHAHIILTAGLLLFGSLNELRAQNSSSYHIAKTFHIAGEPRWDYVSVDSGSDRLFQSHGSEVNILNKTTGDSLGVIPNTTGVHGIAFIDALNKGYISDGKLNAVTVFDLSTFKIVKQIATGQNPDAILYDPFSKKIITCNGRSKDLSVIDPAIDTVVATIALEGKPEEAMSDAEGKVYVNIEDKSEIAVVDIKQNTVIVYWKLAPGVSPTGLAIDRKNRRLFSGCDNKLLIEVDADNGKVVNQFPIGDECDGVGFDPGLKYVFASCGDGTMTVVKEFSKDKAKVIDVITTEKGARTIAVDTKTHKVYLPTADFEMTPPDADGKSKRVYTPGSFRVLMLTQ
jgi:YVTN family beta-propeller protein